MKRGQADFASYFIFIFQFGSKDFTSTHSLVLQFWGLSPPLVLHVLAQCSTTELLFKPLSIPLLNSLPFHGRLLGVLGALENPEYNQ